MRRFSHLGSRLLIVAASLLPWGCGGPTDELPRQAVSGKVTFKGQPLAQGMIQFQPADGGATAGGGAIADGEYSIAKAEGLVPGKYQVVVTSTPPPAPLPPGTMPGDPVPPPKETIPAKYNVKTTLSATVTKEGPNTFDFPLEGK
jgi:hypothetical protein